MSDGLPDGVWSIVFRPFPAWPWSIEPDYDPRTAQAPLAQLEFPKAARDAFAFLVGLGFEPTPPDAWEMTSEAVMVAWERADAVVVAACTADGAFYALAFPRPDDAAGTTVRERLRGLTGKRGTVATFGSFPLIGRTAASVAEALRGYADALRARSASVLADRPLDISKLGASMEEAGEDLRRPRVVASYRVSAEAAWADERYDAYVEAAEHLADLGEPGLDPERMAVALARRHPPLTLGPDVVDEADRIRRAADLVLETHRRVVAAAQDRDNGREAFGRWQDAAREAHQAAGLLYSREFQANLVRLRDGDSTAVEPAITFLEVDPWCFRSGYAKETILRYLPRAELTDDQAERLRRVVLHAVDVGDRREFRGYARLARRVVDDGLRSALLSRLRATDPGRARRALWVLEALAEPFGPDDRARVLAILETAAADARWWRVSEWVARIAQRHPDAAWAASLLDRATSDAPDAQAAVRLLSAARARPSPAQKVALGRTVLREIESDGDSFEHLAVLADTPRLRDDLVALYRRADDPDLRRRTWWAINAIRRSSGDDWPGDLLA